jgi:MinD superfamily P-loop ATPase
MKKLVVISGKGGTGKTTVVGGLALLAKDKILVDCDVDASNLPLIFNTKPKKREPFYGSLLPVVDLTLCNKCGICERECPSDAISEKNQINPLRCEGCGVCAFSCPEKAINMVPRLSGEIIEAETDSAPLIYGELAPGEETSGKLVTAVRKRAEEEAEKVSAKLMIIDGAPGIGCPVIASLTGVDQALVITEPTLSGIHDLDRVIGVAGHFRIKSAVAINKYEVNRKLAGEIEKYCAKEGLPLIGRLPYDETAYQAVVAGKSIMEFPESPLAKAIVNLWRELQAIL